MGGEDQYARGRSQQPGFWKSEGLTAVLECEERVAGGQRLRDRHIQTGCSDLAGGQSLIQVVLVHHTTPGNSIGTDR